MIIVWYLFNLLILNGINLIVCDEALVLVHVMFRHGHRTTDESSVYPNDPYKNETYYPYGYGQLTNEGKLDEYRLGQYFRSRYITFLDDTYTPGLIDVRSTDYNRTKMSLELVLAGLFPPKLKQIWLKGFNWQPIPYNYWPTNHDEVLYGLGCRNYEKYLNEFTESAEYKIKFDEYREIFQFLEQHSGMTNMSFLTACNLYLCLKTELEYGFVLPKWTEQVYPEPLRTIALDSFEIRTGTKPLKQLSAGYLLQKIVNDTVAKLNGDLELQTRKMFLYSGHDITLFSFMRVLGVDIAEMPPYGSSIMVEIHQIDASYGVKIYYRPYAQNEPTLLKLPNCDEFCPLDQFIELYQEYLEDGNICND